jgi:EpsD family peptidyl-prolyl cis-trans isomerase
MQLERFEALAGRAPAPAAALAVAAAAWLAGCGVKDPASTQAAARVNKEEITVHQIGAQLAQQQTVKPEQAPQAERVILERLINRQLAVQKAADLKLDREPKVVQAIESARQEIIARAYADKLGEGAARPTAADIKNYYDEHPVLFAQRKVYQLQEFVVDADPRQIEALKAALPAIKSGDDLVAHLKASNLKFASQQVVRAAEQVPLSVLPALSRLSDGQALLTPTLGGAQLVVLEGARPQPVDAARASRAIEQFLVNEQKRKLLADDLKALRAAARIEYQGRFAAAAPLPDDLVQPGTAAQVAASAAAGLDSRTVNEAPGASAGPVGAASSSQAAGAIDATTLSKGLGLK